MHIIFKNAIAEHLNTVKSKINLATNKKQNNSKSNIDEKEIRARAYHLWEIDSEKREPEYYWTKAIKQIEYERRIRSIAYRLWQEDSEHHESKFYWQQAIKQIKIEKSLDIYRVYSPRKWLFLINRKILKPCVRCLNKFTLISIVERIAIITVFIGSIGFFWEEYQRHKEIIIENWKILAEASQAFEEAEITSLEATQNNHIKTNKNTSTLLPSNVIIRNSLEQLNRRYPGMTPLFDKIPIPFLIDVPFLNLKGAWELFISSLKKETIYNFNEKSRKCEKKLKIQLIYPRWEHVRLNELKLPKNINLSEIGLCDARLEYAELNKITLIDANLAGAYLYNAQLKETDLRLSDMRGSSLVEADLTSANLTGADLAGADLTNADLTNAIFRKGITENNPSKSQLKEACNWDRAFYIYDGDESELYTDPSQWKLNETENQKYIEQIKQDKTSDPDLAPQCEKWENKT